MSTPYEGNDPQQWGQQPPQGPPSGNVPGQQPAYGQQPPQQPGQQPPQQPGYPQQPGQPGYPQQPQPGYGPPPGAPQPGGQPGYPGQAPAPGQPAQTPPPGQPMPPGQPQPGYTQPGMAPQPGGQGTASYTQPGGQAGYPPGQMPPGAMPPGQQPPGQQPFGPQPGVAAAPPAKPKKKSGKGMWFGLGAAVLIVAALAVVLFWVPGLLVQKVFDAEAMNRDVERVLTDNYGVEGVENVSCPEDQAVTVDETFTCDVTVNGEQQQVTITVKSEDARYQVGRLE